MSAILGSLEKVNLSEAWANEAQNFTPWLATGEGLKLLGSTLKFNLQLEKVEKPVGAFRADILAKRLDTDDDHWVLIENQLDKTDHNHLGQLMTYAAGLKAATIIWIASTIREEHRAALDWLNEITSHEFEFYGLEVELWKIGNSPPAPKFNVVCRPNDWQRAAKEQAESITEIKSDLNQLQLAYWTALHEELEKPGHAVTPQKSHPQHWASYAVGKAGAELVATINSKDREIGVSIEIKPPLGKVGFHKLLDQKSEIEALMQADLDWREMPKNKRSKIILIKKDVDPKKIDDWPLQHKWFIDKLELFMKVFRPRVAQLPNIAISELVMLSDAPDAE